MKTWPWMAALLLVGGFWMAGTSQGGEPAGPDKPKAADVKKDKDEPKKDDAKQDNDGEKGNPLVRFFTHTVGEPMRKGLFGGGKKIEKGLKSGARQIDEAFSGDKDEKK
ncbi:MAG: hypothetical protein M5U26_23770 [Planctomycetota bacterium]|nr:hypothetical protein [Planctomycetota bacterium]